MVSGIKDLSKAYAQKYGVTLAEAETVVKNTLSVMTEAIENGGVSYIGNFTIEAVQKSARVGRNPATKEEFNIPASIGLRIRCGKQLKQRLNA